ncbi:MAG: hypothetical protein RLZZ200_2982 [Pseudomonadota bacterium]|jgi:alpha-L-rhamnosidase
MGISVVAIRRSSVSWRMPPLLKGLLSAAALALLSAAAPAKVPAAVSPVTLTVEHRDRPLGIDTTRPRFAWQTAAPTSRRGVIQSAYRIVVSGSGAEPVWDSGRIASGRSTEIPYQGADLRPATRYRWTVSTWYEDGAQASADSWFETGLMDPDPSLRAWEGARWIGGGEADRVLHAQYLPLYEISSGVEILPGSSRAGIVFAANDARLMDADKNPAGLRAARDASYFRVELDISGITGSATSAALLKIYRAGYAAKDDPNVPVQAYRIRNGLINAGNAHARHEILVHAEFGVLGFRIDGDARPFEGVNDARLILNPMLPSGTAPHDVLTFGMLADIGFSMEAGQTARFSDLRVSNTRKPANALFEEKLTSGGYAGLFAAAAGRRGGGLQVDAKGYLLSGGRQGAFVVADPSHGSMPLLRTGFKVRQAPIRAARVYVTARGIYELHLNGKRIGNDWFNPGLSQYNRTHFYQTYDVTKDISPGANALGAALGEGWWSGLLSYGSNWNHFGDRQSLLLKLVIEYADGRRQVVTSNDRDWKFFGQGPLIYSSLYMGEVYDAGREPLISGWSTAAYDTRDWKPAEIVPPEKGTYTSADLDYAQQQLLGQQDEPVREYQAVRARSVREVRRGVFVYDLGQNLVGVPRIRLAAARAGQRIVLRVSEMLYPDLPASGGNVGMIMTENYRAALSQDLYVARSGPQTIQPRFTSHGFRYLEVTGIDRALPLHAVEGLALSSVQKLTAEYRTSDADLNQLWSNIVWSNLGNFLSVPTDCPQRNERMGWSGDLGAFARTATYVSDADAFLMRHLRAMRDTQRAGKFSDIAPVGGGFGGVLWGSAGITVPWEMYQQYGNEAVLREHYPAMVAYVDYLQSLVDPATGLMHDVQLGDWLGPQNLQLGQQFLAVAYHTHDLGIMVQVARLLGHEADAERFATLHRARRDYFNARFIDAEGSTIGYVTGSPIAFGPDALSGTWQKADTQASYAAALGLGVLADDKRTVAARRLADAVGRESKDDEGRMRPANSLMTGFIGTALVSRVLSESGRSDVAYRQLLNRDYPSWLYSVKQGATTIWERLNGYTTTEGFGGNNSMNSFNHYSFGAVGQWLVGNSLGIRRDEAGFRRFVLRPEPDPTGQLKWAEGHYDSPYGRIESAWRITDGATEFDFQVPPNTIATLYLPGGPGEGERKIELRSGRHHFSVRRTKETT